MKKYTCTSCFAQAKSRGKTPAKPLISEYGDWLNTFDWSYFCTFTTRYSLSQKQAYTLMFRLHNYLIERYNFTTNIFWVVEPFDSKYGNHVHALLKIEGKPTKNLPDYIKKAWQIVSNGSYGKEHNFTTIVPYNPTGGAHFYIAKYLHRPDADYYFL